ncbi:hypothetical protein [Gordonia rubripertincta]|uniref:Uncharacterized protein n=1 Tax=Gordonia rubripertincta TaxID=36822 RepID=A0ABT4MXR7_GORRU|nr:hypothetical protein [Gordonia rubripertincta]MCZ4551810.1 hypothetical protein [Gordonia rubripertincta]
MSTGGYVDLSKGEVLDDIFTEASIVGDHAAIDVEGQSDRWLWLDHADSRGGWRGMTAFTERQRDDDLRRRLEHAIDAKRAFSRFRDLIHEGDLADRWHTFSTDRRMGRARELLARDIRVI